MSAESLRHRPSETLLGATPGGSLQLVCRYSGRCNRAHRSLRVRRVDAKLCPARVPLVDSLRKVARATPPMLFSRSV